MERRYEKIRQIVDTELSSSAHDLDHVMRVHALCLRLSEEVSGADLHVLRTAALLDSSASGTSFWNSGHSGYQFAGSVEDYYRLLKSAFLAAKAVDPAVKVSLGGLTYWWDAQYGREPFARVRLHPQLISTCSDTFSPSR